MPDLHKWKNEVYIIYENNSICKKSILKKEREIRGKGFVYIDDMYIMKCIYSQISGEKEKILAKEFFSQLEKWVIGGIYIHSVLKKK